MSPIKNKILAVDPGTREMGVAFLEGERLIYHGVVTIKNNRSPRCKLTEGSEIIQRFLRDFKPDILAVEKTFVANNRTAALLNVMADEIVALGKRRGIKAISFAPSTIRKHICGNGRAVKSDVAQVVVAKYPELKVYLNQNRKWQEKFHANMFDAVAVGLMAQKDKTNS